MSTETTPGMLTTDFGMSADTLVLAYRRPLCWHVDGDNFFCMSTGTIFFACRRRQSFFACRQEQSFLHVDGDNLVWHVDGNNLFGMSTETISSGMSTGTFLHVDGDNLFCMWTETILFGMSTETIFFACRRRQSCFGMSTGTTLLACRQFGMSTRRIPAVQFFSFSRNSAANQWRVHPCAVAMPDMYNCNC